MKFLGLVVLSVLLNIHVCIAQNDETRIWYQDTDWVMSQVDSLGGPHDTLFFIANVAQEQGHFYAFYDSSLEGQLAAHVYFHNDTNIITMFFRSGRIKYISKDYLSSIFYEARWCANGQQIYEEVRRDTMNILNYYCNGNVMNRFTMINRRAYGEYLRWHENGQPSLVGYFERNVKQGEWIYYDKWGVVIRREHWKDGVLIE